MVKFVKVEDANEADNPIFNFSQDFIDGLQKITPIDMGLSVPFINLRSVDQSGQLITDFNLQLFHKPVDLTKLNDISVRYPDRPTASLIELRVKTDLASGYLYFQDVNMTIRIHKPDSVIDGTLIPLLFPGVPFELEYGWKSKNPTLDKREVLLFALKTYNLNYTIDGQADLTIEGTAFNERLNSVYLGDEDEKPGDGTKAARGDTLSANFIKLERYVEYIKDLQGKKDKSGIRDYKLLGTLFEKYSSSLTVTRGKIRENFLRNFAALKDKRQEVKKKDKVKNAKEAIIFKEGFVTIFDLVETMCAKTLDSFSKLLYGRDFRVVYGQFSEDVGGEKSKYKSASISDFPIDYALFRRAMEKYTKQNGTEVLTFEALVTIIKKDFLHNVDYWRKVEKLNPAKNGVVTPTVEVLFHNYRKGDKKVADLVFVDAGRDIPITSSAIKGKTKMSQNDFEKAIVDLSKNQKFPIIRVGHAHSFIKEISMTHVMDQYIKAAFIKKMADSAMIETREFIPPELEVDNDETGTPLTLPLEGTMTVLGHPEWRPFRAFLLSTGIFPIDGVYKITAVEHVLNVQGYTTSITFLYH